MSFFRPQTTRDLAQFLNEVIARWEQLSQEDRASGDWINPDEPIVLSVPNLEFEGKPNEDEDDYGEPRLLHFHVSSLGGGGDIDEDGDDCGHCGVEIGGMYIGPGFYLNGRRLEK